MILGGLAAVGAAYSANVRATDEPAADAPDATQQPAPAAEESGLEEIVVTARRRAENAETTPVSVSALSSDALTERGIHDIQDLDNQVPGFRTSGEGGKNNTQVVMRGLSRIPLGIGIPAVVTYVNDVPVPGIASNIPTFDLDNIQVLKGPQGTLFGRNTLGGAVVLTTQQPTEDFGGYLDYRGGNLGREAVEGAFNAPIIPEKVAFRVAGLYELGHGYYRVLNGPTDMSDTHLHAVRASLLVTPVDGEKDLLY